MKSKYVNGCEKCTPNYPCREHGAKGQTTVMDKPSHTPTIEWNVDPFKDKNGIHDGNVQLWADMPEADAAYVCRAVLVHEALVNTVKTLLSELRWTSQNGEFPGMEYVFKSAEKALAQASGK